MTAVFAFVAGAVVMGIAWWLRRGVERTNWILRGQAQAELSHGWHQPVDGSPVPTPRRRSPNEQFVTQVIPPTRSIVADESR